VRKRKLKKKTDKTKWRERERKGRNDEKWEKRKREIEIGKRQTVSVQDERGKIVIITNKLIHYNNHVSKGIFQIAKVLGNKFYQSKDHV